MKLKKKKKEKNTDHSHNKYITTAELNELTAENFAARLSQANLSTKEDFDERMKNINKKLLQAK